MLKLRKPHQNKKILYLSSHLLFLKADYLLYYSCLLPNIVHMNSMGNCSFYAPDIILNFMVTGMTSSTPILLKSTGVIDLIHQKMIHPSKVVLNLSWHSLKFYSCFYHIAKNYFHITSDSINNRIENRYFPSLLSLSTRSHKINVHKMDFHQWKKSKLHQHSKKMITLVNKK